MDIINKLTGEFRSFPGIGPRQARRFVYYLLTRDSAYLSRLAELIKSVKEEVSVCTLCMRFSLKSESHGTQCKICADQNRDHTTLLLVARDADFETIERAGVYRGVYFVLGGTVPVLEAEPERLLRLQELEKRIRESNQKITEIILGLNATPDGEHTSDVVKEWLKGLGIKTSLLGRGLSTGSELEYSDSDTIRSALANRN